MKDKNNTRPTAERRQLAPIDELMPLICERLKEGQSVKLSPRGISMLPMLREGIDSVVLSPVTGKLKKYDIPLYRRPNGQYVLHRIVGVDQEGYTCVGDNQYRREHGVDHANVLAVVTAFARGDKHYDVSSRFYRVYCRLWHWTRFPRHACRAVGRRLLRLFKRKK